MYIEISKRDLPQIHCTRWDAGALPGAGAAPEPTTQCFGCDDDDDDDDEADEADCEDPEDFPVSEEQQQRAQKKTTMLGTAASRARALSPLAAPPAASRSLTGCACFTHAALDKVHVSVSGLLVKANAALFVARQEVKKTPRYHVKDSRHAEAEELYYVAQANERAMMRTADDARRALHRLPRTLTQLRLPVADEAAKGRPKRPLVFYRIL